MSYSLIYALNKSSRLNAEQITVNTQCKSGYICETPLNSKPTSQELNCFLLMTKDPEME